MVSHAPTNQGLPSPTETAVWEGIAALCLLGALGTAWWLLRACVIGGSDGLRGRQAGGWKSVRWDEVSDYYEQLPTQIQRSSGKSSVAAVSIIEASFCKFGVTNLWSHAEALRDLVEQNAVQSRATQWEIKGTRAFDPWPRLFDYDTLENRWAPRIWLKLFLIFVMYLLVRPALQLGVMAGLVGWTMTLITAGLYLLLIGSIGLIFLFPLAQYRAAEQRKAERITADLYGVAFEDGARRLEAAWPDVTGYHTVYGQGITVRYAVETHWGDFDFLPSIGNAALLRTIIQRFAAEAAGHEWDSLVDANTLGGEAARWSGGKAGSGKRRFHYQTRANRALLFGGGVLGFVSLFLSVISVLGWLPGTSPPLPLAFGSSIGWILLLVLGWRGYKQNAVFVSNEGLSQRTLTGSRSIPWEQIRNYTLGQEGGGTVAGRTETIKFSSQIVGCEELKEEIARCAVGCGGTWEKPTKIVSDARRRGKITPK